MSKQLIQAVAAGDYPTVQKIFAAKGFNKQVVEFKDGAGLTALHHAALNGHVDILQLLIQFADDINVLDMQQMTPLHHAAWNNKPDAIKCLALKGALVDLQNINGEAAVHIAAKFGNQESLSHLVEYGASPCACTKGGDSPLDLAAQSGRAKIVDYLLNLQRDMGYEILALTAPVLADGAFPPRSPLHLAAANGHLPVVESLIKFGFDINFKAQSGTPLQEAARRRKFDCVRVLLEAGAATNLVGVADEECLAALMPCLQKDGDTTDRVQVCKLLAGAGEDDLSLATDRLNELLRAQEDEKARLSRNKQGSKRGLFRQNTQDAPAGLASPPLSPQVSRSVLPLAESPDNTAPPPHMHSSAASKPRSASLLAPALEHIKLAGEAEGAAVYPQPDSSAIFAGPEASAPTTIDDRQDDLSLVQVDAPGDFTDHSNGASASIPVDGGRVAALGEAEDDEEEEILSRSPALEASYVKIEEEVLREGQLTKRPQRYKKPKFMQGTSSKERWFVLTASAIRYYQGSSAKGSLKGCILTSSIHSVEPIAQTDSGVFMFEVTHDSGVLVCLPKSIQERNAWIEAIRGVSSETIQRPHPSVSGVDSAGSSSGAGPIKSILNKSKKGRKDSSASTLSDVTTVTTFEVPLDPPSSETGAPSSAPSSSTSAPSVTIPAQPGAEDCARSVSSENPAALNPATQPLSGASEALMSLASCGTLEVPGGLPKAADASLLQFLEQKRLDQYKDNLIGGGVLSLENLIDMGENMDQVLAGLGVSLIGHRRKFAVAVDEIKAARGAGGSDSVAGMAVP